MSIILNAKKRDEKIKLDTNFYIPANLYGKNIKNINLEIKKADFDKVWDEAGESNLIDLKLDNESIKALIKEVQYHPVKDTPLHVDFYQVNMKEKITTEIPLEFIGESKAVKELNGLLMRQVDSVLVRCLPGDLIDHIEVDISSLETFGDSIHMEDLILPKSMELLHEGDEIVVSAIAPKVEEKVEEETDDKKEEVEEEKEEGDKSNEEKKDETEK